MTLQNIERFADKDIVDVGKEVAGQELSEEEKKEQGQKNADSEQMRAWMKEVLGERITRVEVRVLLYYCSPFFSCL
jgi:HSP90 family molecular chaperone